MSTFQLQPHFGEPVPVTAHSRFVNGSICGQCEERCYGVRDTWQWGMTRGSNLVRVALTKLTYLLEPERPPLRAPLETGDVNKRKYRPFNRARHSKEQRKNPGI